MANRLKSILTVAALAPGASVVLAHGIRVAGYPRKPNRIDRDNGDLAVSDVTDTSLTVTNSGSSPASGRLLVEAWHSTSRTLGGSAPPEVPFVAGGGGSGGGGGGSGFTVTPLNVSTPEDVTRNGTVMTNVVSPSATPSVMQYIVAGVGGDPGTVYAANATAVIPGRGTFTLEADGDFTFVPVGDYNGGLPLITCWITNGSELRTLPLTITVAPANDGPTAGPAYALSFSGEAVDVDLLDFATDPDGDTLTVTAINSVTPVIGNPVSVTGGTYTYQGNGVVRVTPSNANVPPIELTYAVSDGFLSSSSTVTVQVGVANLPLFSPVAPILSNAVDQAAVNFGKTYRFKYGPTDDNGVNVATPPYSAGQGLADLNNREPWLYDRATTLWLLAKRTNDAAILAEAMALAERYMAAVNVSGSGLGTFTIIGSTGGDPTDVKYLYGIIAWWYEYERLRAGATTQQAQVYRSRAQALYRQTLQSFTKTYNAGSAELWTERNAWAAITNCLAWYWISGDAVALADAEDYVDDIILLSTASGAPLHSKDKHEQDGDPTPIISPWMSALLAEAMVQFYRTTGDSRIPTWLSNYGDWLIANAFYVANGASEPELAGLAGLRVPAYLAGTGVQFPEGEQADMQHSVDVRGLLQKVRWAKQQLSLSTAAVDALIDELAGVAAVDIAYWTRTTVGYPRYRVNPPRSYGWRYRSAYSTVISVGIVPFPPSLTTAPVASGSTQQGSTLSCTTGVWAGNPAPTYTYQWRRNGVAIGGAASNTYVTQGPDVGQPITCRVTATNAGGSATGDSNAITPVPAGAPEVTQHPVNASALVGATAQFTAACTATPTATYQWQVSTNAGGSWTDVTSGAGGAGTGNTTTYTTATLVAGNDGNQYRCVFTNAGGSATTNSATLALVVDQGAVRFVGDTAGAQLVFDLGAAGHRDFVVEALVYLEGTASSAQIFGIRHTGNGRSLTVQYNNAFPTPLAGPGDSNTGVTVFADQPPLNTWLHMTLQCQSAGDGSQVRATWTTAEGAAGTRYAATRANGIEGSVQAQATFIGGLALGNGVEAGVRFQFVRGRTGNLANAVVDGHRQDTDTAGWSFWWRFYDNGGGGVAVQDKTGNNRVPAMTGATLAAGPVVPSVP